MVMTVEPPQCAWYVVRCCVPRAIAVRQSLRGPQWGQLQNMPINVVEELVSSSGTAHNLTSEGLFWRDKHFATNFMKIDGVVY